MPIYLKGARAETSYRILYKLKDRYNVQYVISRFGIAHYPNPRDYRKQIINVTHSENKAKARSK